MGPECLQKSISLPQKSHLVVIWIIMQGAILPILLVRNHPPNVLCRNQNYVSSFSVGLNVGKLFILMEKAYINMNSAEKDFSHIMR